MLSRIGERLWSSPSSNNSSSSNNNADEDDDRKMPARSSNSSNRRQRQQQSSPGIMQMGEVIDMMDVDDDDDDDSVTEVPAAAAAAAASSSSNNNNNNTQDVPDDCWQCPQCTLYNPKTSNVCNACHYYRSIGGSSNNYSSDGVRSPDPVRRGERLIPENYSPSSPLTYLSGGALLGGVLGATGAYLQGRPMASSAVNGAVSGAVGGAVLNEMFGNSNSAASRQQQQQRAYQQAAMAYAQQQQQRSMAEARAQLAHAQQLQQQSVAAARAHNPYLRSTAGGDLRRRTTTVRRGPNGAMMMSSTGGVAADMDPFMSMLMQRHGGGFGGGGGGMNIDRMSYEQLLARFGDGSENMGASAVDISQLPVSTLNDPSSLPEDRRQCNICLEDFEVGEKRKVLPCLHGFHCTCIDKWLASNGSCPICKHKIGQNGG